MTMVGPEVAGIRGRRVGMVAEEEVHHTADRLWQTMRGVDMIIVVGEVDEAIQMAMGDLQMEEDGRQR